MSRKQKEKVKRLRDILTIWAKMTIEKIPIMSGYPDMYEAKLKSNMPIYNEVPIFKTA